MTPHKPFIPDSALGLISKICAVIGLKRFEISFFEEPLSRQINVIISSKLILEREDVNSPTKVADIICLIRDDIEKSDFVQSLLAEVREEAKGFKNLADARLEEIKKLKQYQDYYELKYEMKNGNRRS